MLSIMLLIFLVCWPGRLRAQDATSLPAEPRRTVRPGVAVFDAHDFENPHGARCVFDADHPCAPQKLLRALQDVLRLAEDALQTEYVARTPWPWPDQGRGEADSQETRGKVLAAARKTVQDCVAVEAQGPVTPQAPWTTPFRPRARPLTTPLTVGEQSPQVLRITVPGPADADLVYMHGITVPSGGGLHLMAPEGATAADGERLIIEIQSTGAQPIPIHWDAVYSAEALVPLPSATHGTQAHPLYDQWTFLYYAQHWVLINASTSDTSLVPRTKRMP